MNKFVVFLLIFSTTFFSCKKQKDVIISYMVKTKTSSQNNNNTETYTYDSENRIIKITNSNLALAKPKVLHAKSLVTNKITKVVQAK